MKKYLILLILSLFLEELSAQSFQLNGIINGAKNGSIVKLVDQDLYPYKIIDSVLIKDEKFALKGSFNYPEKYCSLMIDSSPLEKDELKKDLRIYEFFATNSDMTIEGKLDDIPSYYYGSDSKYNRIKFKGSLAQQIYSRYMDMTLGMENNKNQLMDDYSRIYHRPSMYGVINSQQGIDIVKESEKLNKTINAVTKNFISHYNTSIVSVFLAHRLIMSNGTKLTEKEIDDIVALFKDDAGTNVWLSTLKNAAEEKKAVAKGVNFHDIYLKNEKEEVVKLSMFIEKGKYTFLEFWASWCVPCRAEIPHLKDLYKSIPRKNINFISISIDEKESDWKRALSEEKMAWTQLRDDKGENGPVSKDYKIFSVPFCLILDPNGKIVEGGLRGAELDHRLTEIFGKEASGSM